MAALHGSAALRCFFVGKLFDWLNHHIPQKNEAKPSSASEELAGSELANILVLTCGCSFVQVNIWMIFGEN